MAQKKPKKLPRLFYARSTLKVAPDLLGKYVIHQNGSATLAARIVEVEAYTSQGDPACHAARGQTRRNEVMFGPAGHAYVYFIYGMYHCLNFVTEPNGTAAAVLLRAAEGTDGLEQMRSMAPSKKDCRLLAGPGLFCRLFGLTNDDNGLDLTGPRLYLENRFENEVRVAKSTRIGISKGKENIWRFYDADSLSVSRVR